MSELSSAILDEIKKRGIFSEYLPSSFKVDISVRDIYNLGASYRDTIKPYSYTMSRYGKKGDRRKISIPEISAYVSLIEYLKNTDTILDDMVDLAVNDINSFSRIVNSENQIVVDDGGYSDLVLLSGGIGSSVLHEEDIKHKAFLKNMIKKINMTKGACGILHIDISEFYKSIYTHAISSIKIGIEKAQEAYETDSDDLDYQKYTRLDKRVRAMNNNKTNGLLIGPYISKLISESVLAKVDSELRNQNLVFTRYADDYEFAIYNIEEIEKTKSIVTDVFDKYFLRINNEKTKFEEYPFYVFSNFEKVIGKIKSMDAFEVVELFNAFWELEKKGEKGAIRYLLKAYQEHYEVEDKEVYTDYLINILCNDEKALGLACEIIIKEYENDRIKMESSTYEVILKKLNKEISYEHEFEAIWLVYLLKYIKFDFTKELIEKILESKFELLKVLMISEFDTDKIPLSKLKEEYEKATSWIYLYELARRLKNKHEYYLKLKIEKNKNFYDKLFEMDFSFYHKRS